MELFLIFSIFPFFFFISAGKTCVVFMSSPRLHCLQQSRFCCCCCFFFQNEKKTESFYRVFFIFIFFFRFFLSRFDSPFTAHCFSVVASTLKNGSHFFLQKINSFWYRPVKKQTEMEWLFFFFLNKFWCYLFFLFLMKKNDNNKTDEDILILTCGIRATPKQ